MKNLGLLLFLVVAFVLSQVNPVFADDEIWDKLASKASFIGFELKRSGYIIAGLGLIVFSFMAIFNKISWKNLVYIMLSCFVLSTMALIVNYFSDAQSEESLKVSNFDTSVATDTSIKGGVTKASGTKPKL